MKLDGATLYDAQWAPSPRRVRIFLAEKGVEVDRAMVDLKRDEQLGDPYLAINPRGAVPALRLASGEVICESAAICRYVEALWPEPRLFGASPEEIARIESWTRRIENDGYAAVVYAFRNDRPAFAGRGAAGKWPEIAQIPELAARGLVMWQAFVEALEARLADREWIATETYSFADVTCLITLDFARSARLPWPDAAPNIARWHAAAGTRPSATA